jgi:hypothetical protein
MWAMIGTCIAMVFWTSGLLYITNRAEKRSIVEAREDGMEAEKKFEAAAGGDSKV